MSTILLRSQCVSTWANFTEVIHIKWNSKMRQLFYDRLWRNIAAHQISQNENVVTGLHGNWWSSQALLTDGRGVCLSMSLGKTTSEWRQYCLICYFVWFHLVWWHRTVIDSHRNFDENMIHCVVSTVLTVDLAPIGAAGTGMANDMTWWAKCEIFLKQHFEMYSLDLIWFFFIIKFHRSLFLEVQLTSQHWFSYDLVPNRLQAAFLRWWQSNSLI